MEITEVRVHKIDREGSKVKGYAKIIVDGCLEINNIRIIQREDRLFCAMPSRKVSEDKFEDYVHPINKETRAMLEEKILTEYNNL